MKGPSIHAFLLETIEEYNFLVKWSLSDWWSMEKLQWEKLTLIPLSNKCNKFTLMPLSKTSFGEGTMQSMKMQEQSWGQRKLHRRCVLGKAPMYCYKIWLFGILTLQWMERLVVPAWERFYLLQHVDLWRIFGAKSKRKDFAPTSGKLWSSAAAKAFISSRYLKVSQNRLPREIFHF